MTDPAPITTPVVQVLPFEVRIVRWWNNTGIWVTLWSLVELWLPILLLTDFQVLGFSSKWAGVIGLALKLINVSISLLAKNRSVSVIGNKQDVAAAAQAPDAQPVAAP